MTKICFYCGEKITIDDQYQMLGLDVPYLNLFFHKNTCWKNIYSNINLYLSENMEKLYNWIDKNDNKKQGNRT